jgi:hypothetical protein
MRLRWKQGEGADLMAGGPCKGRSIDRTASHESTLGLKMRWVRAVERHCSRRGGGDHRLTRPHASPQAITRKVRILDVCYNASNNELVRPIEETEHGHVQAWAHAWAT